jgi:transposase
VAFLGQNTGPNPTDRAKAGIKHHVLTDVNGVPLAATVTGANRHDVTQLLPLVDAFPTIRGKPSAPITKSPAVIGDRGYDSDPHRRELRKRHVDPVLVDRGVGHGSGLGKLRWPVERAISWLHQARRLRVRYDKRADVHKAFVRLRCDVICWLQLLPFC